MSLQSLQLISEAEERAKESKTQATADAKRMIAQAEEEGRLSVDAARKKAEEELRELVSNAGEKAKQDAIDLANSTENRKATMLVKAESRAQKAIDLVIERIVNG